MSNLWCTHHRRKKKNPCRCCMGWWCQFHKMNISIGWSRRDIGKMESSPSFENWILKFWVVLFQSFLQPSMLGLLPTAHRLVVGYKYPVKNLLQEPEAMKPCTFNLWYSLEWNMASAASHPCPWTCHSASIDNLEDKLQKMQVRKEKVASNVKPRWRKKEWRETFARSKNNGWVGENTIYRHTQLVNFSHNFAETVQYLRIDI